MPTKSDLVTKILDELRIAQHEPWVPLPDGQVTELRFPPNLPIGDEMEISATDALLEAIDSYSKILSANDPALKSRFRQDELYQLATLAFGKVLKSIDLDQTNATLCDAVKSETDKQIYELAANHEQPLMLTLGCHLLDGDAAYPILIGPVVFETREQWRLRSESEGKITAITSRRLSSAWSGNKARKRNPSDDSSYERALLDMVDSCSIICTISTKGLSSKMLKEKGLLAARLAMAAVSLIWQRPSKALDWMNLNYDGSLFLRRYVLFREKGGAGYSSSISQLPKGRWTDDQLISTLHSYQWLFDQVGEALFNYAQPMQSVARPKVMNALLLSLWWFYEACRESSDQMAVTKFAASMDAISGGHKARGIIKFIEARLGKTADQPIMTDGSTVRKIVKEFYDDGRSRMVHGSSSDFGHDWTNNRATAEVVSRHCLIAACNWLSTHPKVDDLGAMSQQ